MRNKITKLFISLCLILLAGVAAYSVVSKYRHQNDYVPPSQNAYIPNKPDEIKKNYVLINAPFTSQAPNAKWSDPRQQDACEEASVVMAWLWLNNKTMTTDEPEKELIAISDFEQSAYGKYHDTEPNAPVSFI